MADGLRRAHHPSRRGEPLPPAHGASPAGDVQEGVLGTPGEGWPDSSPWAPATTSATSTSGISPPPTTTGSTAIPAGWSSARASRRGSKTSRHAAASARRRSGATSAPTGSSTLLRYMFYRPSFGAPRRLWVPGDMGILEPGYTSFDQVCATSNGAQELRLRPDPHRQRDLRAGGPARCSRPAWHPRSRRRGSTRSGNAWPPPPIPTRKPINVDNTGDAAAAGKRPEDVGRAGAKPAPVAEQEGAPGGPARRRAQVADGVRRADHPAGGGESLPRAGTAVPARGVQDGFLGAARQEPTCRNPSGRATSSATKRLRRLADEKYDGWKQDAGRLVVLRGEPASIMTPNCGGEETFRDLEVWTYNDLAPTIARPTDFSSTVRCRWRPASSGRWWTANRTSSCRIPAARAWPSSPGLPGGHGGSLQPVPDRCEVYQAFEETRSRQETAPAP